jgi:hypothetical protein
VIANAPWAGRSGHTTVIDVDGTMYLIGGAGETGFFNDVWQSRDGGADRTRGLVMGTQRVLPGGVPRRSSRVLSGTLGYSAGSQMHSSGTQGVLYVYSGTEGGTEGVTNGALTGTQEALKRQSSGI